jgi:MFS transporter, ACS family, glucarate transporter
VTDQVQSGQAFITNARPSKVRWAVVVLLAATAGLTYIDRLNLGIVARNVQEEFKFSTETMGWILGTFSLGYAIFHIPGGWLADRFGTRRVLSAAILWFSVFAGLTAVAPNLLIVGLLGPAWAFAIVRFGLGTGEAAAMPVGNKVMAYWLGPRERGFGTSLFLSGVGAGGVAAPIVITWLTKNWGWRWPFLLSAIFGAIVAGACYFLVTDRPEDNPHVNSSELALIRGPAGSAPRAPSEARAHVPWRKILSTPSIWGLMIAHFCLVYPVYIFVTWFFVYLVKVRGVTVSKAGFWGSAPFIANLLMVPLWGRLEDLAAARMGTRRGRRACAWLGIGASALLLWSGTHTANNTVALCELALAAGFNFAASAVLWTTCNDISVQCSASISGIMTTFGSLGGWLSPVLTAKIATRFGWNQALDFAALVTCISALAWLLINAERTIE